MVSALDPWSSGLGSSPGRRYCTVLLENLYLAMTPAFAHLAWLFHVVLLSTQFDFRLLVLFQTISCYGAFPVDVSTYFPLPLGLSRERFPEFDGHY